MWSRSSRRTSSRSKRSRPRSSRRSRPTARGARSPRVHDKIEDERAGGSRLTEIAQKLNLKARTIEAVDRQGRDPDGKPISGLRPASTISFPARSAPTSASRTSRCRWPGGGYLWFEVAGRQALGRAHARRGARAGRAALARGSGLRAAEGQGERDRRAS